MIRYDKNSWPQFTIGAKRVRFHWFGQTWLAHWAEICWDTPGYPKRRLMGHVGWIAFWLDRKHLTLALGPHVGTWGFTLRGGE